MVQINDGRVVDTRLPTAIFAGDLGLVDPLPLTLSANIGLKLRHGPQNGQDELPHAGVGIDPGLLEAAELDALTGEPGDNVVEVIGRPGEPIKATDDQRIPLADELQRLLEAIAAIGGRAALLLREDLLASSARQ